MRRRFGIGAGAALVAWFGAVTLAPGSSTPVLNQRPPGQSVQRAQEDVATLKLAIAALPEKDRRRAERLLRDASDRITTAQDVSATGNARLAKHALRELRVAERRIEDARRLVEQGGGR